MLLLACHSEPFGDILVKAGAEHAIVVDKDKGLRDDVAICFSRHFYFYYRKLTKICLAFEYAINDTKKAFEKEPSEVDRLKLIKKGGIDHICNKPECPRDGPMIDSSPSVLLEP